MNQGRLFVSLKSADQRRSSSKEVIARLRGRLPNLALSAYMVPSQDLRAGGRLSKAQYQFTLSSPSLEILEAWRDKVLARLKQAPELVDVTTDQERGGLRAKIVIDRNAASRMNVQIAAIDAALNSAFGQRAERDHLYSAQPVSRDL